ncbi:MULTISPECIES: hypothetical protein [Pseudomonas]|uniref:hypothetical protein n=1 Tax=Pseudomonas TaxID=286 RepID=UPI00057F9E88|nr:MULTISPECIES: hypothetical protein [Pseudomonas]AMK37628.1 hypothetical protein [Pseudomonas sp. C5pp]KIC79548.1 hypothetical protein RR51_26260 [Pseudomonas sp. C5pp]QUG92794.1 hypothetical protein GR140_28990 [Pseudomonas putida]
MSTKIELPATISTAQQWILAAEAAKAVGCAVRSYELAAWQARSDPTVGAGEPIPAEYRKRWNALFRGVKWRSTTWERLYPLCPILQGVHDDILWTALDPGIPSQVFDECLLTWRLSGKPLPMCSPSTMESLCGCPSWRRLGYLLIILRSRSPQFCLLRCWVRKNFLAYCALTSLPPYGHLAALALYDLFTRLFQAAPQETPDNWPAHRWGYMKDRALFRRLGHFLIVQRWVDGWDDRCLMWLWHLVHKRNSLHLTRLCQAGGSESALLLPWRLATCVEKALKGDQDFQLEFDLRGLRTAGRRSSA